MVTEIVAISAGGGGGAITGGIVAWYQARRQHQKTEQPAVAHDRPPVADGRIDAVAAQWAQAHGRPEAATLVARKLRLVQRLREQASGRWSQ